MSTIINAAHRFNTKFRTFFSRQKAEVHTIDLSQYFSVSVDTAAGEETFYVSRFAQDGIENFFRSDVDREYELISAEEFEMCNEMYHRVKITSKCLRYSMTGIVDSYGVFTVRGCSRRSV